MPRYSVFKFSFLVAYVVEAYWQGIQFLLMNIFNIRDFDDKSREEFYIYHPRYYQSVVLVLSFFRKECLVISSPVR